MATQSITQFRSCPVCGGTMKLARVFPKFGSLPELRTYQCLCCDELLTAEGNTTFAHA
jgi:hypothetical protein